MSFTPTERRLAAAVAVFALAIGLMVAFARPANAVVHCNEVAVKARTVHTGKVLLHLTDNVETYTEVRYLPCLKELGGHRVKPFIRPWKAWFVVKMHGLWSCNPIPGSGLNEVRWTLRFRDRDHHLYGVHRKLDCEGDGVMSKRVRLWKKVGRLHTGIHHKFPKVHVHIETDWHDYPNAHEKWTWELPFVDFIPWREAVKRA